MKVLISIVLLISFVGCNEAAKKEHVKDKELVEKKPIGIKHTIAPARTDLDKSKN